MIKNKQVLTKSLSTIWENTDGCAEQYGFDSSLYLMSVTSQIYSIIIDRGISAPGHGKEVFDGFNDFDKSYIYQLMSKVQLPGSVRFDSEIKMYTGTENKDISLAQEIKNNLEEEHRQNGAIDQGKPRKIFMERKWTEIKYHVQDNDAVELKDVKIYCNTNQFPALPFCGPHSKPHGARGLIKHYHLCFYPKLGMGVCAIRCIPCACVVCTSMLGKAWISDISSYKQERYKPVTKCTYWKVLGTFNNWYIIPLSSKSTLSDTFDEINQVVLDGISDNMASLVESETYGAIKKQTHQQMDFMSSCSHQGNIHYSKTQQLMDKL